ncbi:Rossmann-like domain-containing protein [Desulfocurvus sp. DL9XJH121]
MAGVLDQVRERAVALWEREGILEESVAVKARVLSTEEAIGNPEGDDFPLQQGRERLMEAVFRGCPGQAFTDRFGDFSARLADIAAMPLSNNFRRAVFVASLNAVMRSLGQAQGTIHCRDTGPAECAGLLAEHVAKTYGRVKVGQVGFQPAMVQALGRETDLRVLDMDPDNIGQVRRGCLVEGPEATDEVVAWADLLVVTGTTLANDTVDRFLEPGKPLIFFGTTISGAAALMGWQRFCARST